MFAFTALLLEGFFLAPVVFPLLVIDFLAPGLAGAFFSNFAKAADVFTHVDPVPMDAIDKVVDEKFKVRRVLGGGKLYCNHCKIVCVDDRMLYIGSDNAYPSYNQEHGMWVENTDAVKAWKNKFWNENWKRATPDPEGTK